MVVKLSSKGQLIIPQPIRAAMGLQPGDAFNVYQEGNRIMLEPVDWYSPIDALYGKYRESDLLADLAAEHTQELTRDNRR
ncbi:MAG: AbrB/MazE/SpoVT family DNA-binding domain-containing protein [Chloroflexi bacterium]|nr:AbrB/MazE/SpoVT family DNA-binding domain-containing protein [Chloroflexota bacterium]